jgi:hypothetical protein
MCTRVPETFFFFFFFFYLFSSGVPTALPFPPLS